MISTMTSTLTCIHTKGLDMGGTLKDLVRSVCLLENHAQSKST